MQLADGPRQVLAGLAGALVFLAAFFGAALVWWLALALALAVYGAVLLIVPRRRPLEEIRLSGATTAADMAAAAEALDDAARRLTAAADTAPESDAAAIREMGTHVASIRRSLLEDPEDYRPTRRFVGFYLPGIVGTVESYVALAGRARGAEAERVAALSDRIRQFGAVVARIDSACIENDLSALEVEVDVLSRQLDRVPT